MKMQSERLITRQFDKVDPQIELLTKILNGFSNYVNEMVNIQK